MSILRELFINILCTPLYWIGRMLPKDPNTWVFGAWFGHRYSDNPRYVFEHVHSSEPEIRAVWVSREKKIVGELRAAGYEAYDLQSFKGFWLSCRAAAVFLSCGQTDLNLVGSRHAVTVQLWHGIPLKRIKADDEKSRYSKSSWAFRGFRGLWMYLFPFDGEDWDLLITSGPEMTRRMKSAFTGFMAEDGQVLELGNPRADRILGPADPAVMEPFRKPYSVKRVACYAPTFRGSSSTLDLFDGLDASALGRVLQEWDAVLLVKLHFYDRDRVRSDGFPERVHFVTDAELEDINLLLPHIDVLITDYSSVFFDFLLLNRPILFSPFDIDSYLADERGLYEPYREAVPGEICMNWDELIMQLAGVFRGEDVYEAERLLQRGRFFNHADQNNSRRIAEYLKTRL